MIAEVTVPNIKPMIKIEVVFLTLFAVVMTAIKTNAAPKLEAITNPQLDSETVTKIPPKILDPNIKRATPKLAPDDIPNTKGPANGFLNNVCINKPLIANPEPTKIAVSALGSLNWRRMTSQLGFELLPPIKTSKVSERGMDTDPILKLIKNNKINTKKSAINCFEYDFLCINFKGSLKSELIYQRQSRDD